ncbi:MAG: hypothetical protein GXO40_01180 [Epsilonproteobacteria bacterium]|nr:hypothetical protein [Campylobacterota bacterium]
MGIRLAKHNLTTLLDDLIFPLERQILNEPSLANILSNATSISKHNFAIAKFSINLLYDSDKSHETIHKVFETHTNLNIDKNDTVRYLNIFLDLHQKWVEKYNINNKNYIQILNSIQNTIDELGSEDFFFVEEEEIDNTIEQMHYTDEKKISASEYFGYNEIIDDNLAAIIELSDECEMITYKYTQLDQNFLNDFTHIIHILSNALFSSIEFKDVAYAMNNLMNELQSLDISTLDEIQKELAYNLLYQINQDIQNWIQTIFIDKTAIDIHYFDASFLANIEQFNIMLNFHQDDDDDFLF